MNPYAALLADEEARHAWYRARVGEISADLTYITSAGYALRRFYHLVKDTDWAREDFFEGDLGALRRKTLEDLLASILRKEQTLRTLVKTPAGHLSPAARQISDMAHLLRQVFIHQGDWAVEEDISYLLCLRDQNTIRGPRIWPSPRG